MNPFDHLNRIARDASKPVFFLAFSAAMVEAVPHGFLTAVFIGSTFASFAWLVVYALGLAGWQLSGGSLPSEQAPAAIAAATAVSQPSAQRRPQIHATPRSRQPAAVPEALRPYHVTLTAARANGRLPRASANGLTKIGIRKDTPGNPAKQCRQALLTAGHIDRDGYFTEKGIAVYPSPVRLQPVEETTTAGGNSTILAGGGGGGGVLAAASAG